MGVVTKTVTTYTCDLCKSPCGPEDGLVRIEVHLGDGRDVGPGYMQAVFIVTLPYVTGTGVVCEQCKLKWLRRYVEKHPTHPAQENAP